MKKKKLTLWLFFGTFTLLLLAGLGLTVFSVATIPNQGASILEWSMEGQKVSFKLTTGIPGLIITAFGFLGLLTLLIKVPIKAPLAELYDRGHFNFFGPSLSYSQLLGASNKVPFLFYWLFYRKAPNVRTKDNLG